MGFLESGILAKWDFGEKKFWECGILRKFGKWDVGKWDFGKGRFKKNKNVGFMQRSSDQSQPGRAQSDG